MRRNARAIRALVILRNANWQRCSSCARAACGSRSTILAPAVPRWSYLDRFPFDKVKIDRSFVKGIVDEGASWAIVQAVVNIAAASNMRTTAEGVEQEWQRELLRELGCTEMQGYLFSAAIPAGEIRRMLMSHQGRGVSAGFTPVRISSSG